MLTPAPMKKAVICTCVAAIVMAAGVGARAGEPSPCDIHEFGLDAGKFYLYLTQDTPYTGWQLWPGSSTMHKADSPHGPLVTTYVNPPAYESLATGHELKAGSLIVMENYGLDGDLRGLSVRLKIKDYYPAGNDWYWLQYDGKGEATREGKGHECLRCHAREKGNGETGAAPR
ncbi:MAG: hypothetical protein FIA94_14175 [Nitrospirae bacterium]|nr:hypothetical protein [Nitrospirota bacterium]